MKIFKKNIILKLLYLIFLIVFVQSCLIVKKTEKEENVPIISYTISPKPEIPMSDELIRSKKGDMIALLPKDWFLVDVENKASSDIFAVAVNPDYTLSAVFSDFRINEINKPVINKEGLLGLARLSLEKHSQKSGWSIKQVGKYSIIKMGGLSFAKYEYSNGTSNPPVKVAVFISNQNECYEFALAPLSFENKEYPMQSDIDMIFRSILSSIQY